MTRRAQFGSGSANNPSAVNADNVTTRSFSYDITEDYPTYPNNLPGEGTTSLRPLPQVNNPIIAPDDADITVSPDGVADPFLIKHDGSYYIYAELIAGGSGGENIIGCWSSEGGLRAEDWSFEGVALDENADPNHAYPDTLKWDGEVYLMPVNGSEEFRIYRATEFPNDPAGFEFVETALSTAELGISGGFGEPTVFRWDGRWWLFFNDVANSNAMRIWYSDVTEEGPVGRSWSEHPNNPVVTTGSGNPRIQGRPMVGDDYIDLWRRGRISLVRVTDLSTTTYSETQLTPDPILGAEPNALGAPHHIDMMRANDGTDVAVVDFDDTSDPTYNYHLTLFTTADRSGAFTKVAPTSNDTIPGDGTEYSLDFDTYHKVDPITPSDALNYISIRENGYYQVSGQVTLTGISSTDTPFTLKLILYNQTPDENVVEIEKTVTEDGTQTFVIPATMEYLNRLDRVRLNVSQDSGVNQTVLNGRKSTHLTIAKMW